MKTDPRKACANTKENAFWAVVHDLVAHAAMGISFYSTASLRFHDWTSRKAWPRPSDGFKKSPDWVLRATNLDGVVVVRDVSTGIWSISHPTVSHKFVTRAVSKQEALQKGLLWFKELEREFGGDFQLS